MALIEIHICRVLAKTCPSNNFRHHQTGSDWVDDDPAPRNHSRYRSHRVARYLAVVKRVPPDADDVDLKLSQRHQHHHEALNMNLSSNHARSVVFLD